MTLDANLEIIAVVANTIPLAGGKCMYGDVYKHLEGMLAAHPGEKPLFGAIVADRKTGLVADGYEDFYGSVDEAFAAWQANSMKPFRLTLEYDGSCELKISYNDGSDDEFHDARTRKEVLGIAAEAIGTALSPEDE
ncbi:MAG: hypothetical protein NC311_10090 [Muribaculaceae bacterium]|nr:hypothetical protein [Muribaculaceae bacterium]